MRLFFLLSTIWDEEIEGKVSSPSRSVSDHIIIIAAELIVIFGAVTLDNACAVPKIQIPFKNNEICKIQLLIVPMADHCVTNILFVM
jgi:hypothetical protein